jgi:hypothetical protein
MKTCLVVMLVALAALSTAARAAENPQTVVARAMAAMGGEARLRAITALSYSAVGERQMAEQSERPTGPYFLDHFKVAEVRDIAHLRTRIETTDQAYAADHWWTKDEPATTVQVLNGETSTIVGDGKFQYAGGYGVADNDDQYAFAPERVLLTASAAGDLRSLPDVTLHGVRHHVVAFHYHGYPVTLSINADANLPWQVTWTRAFPTSTFLNPWGDVATSITYTAWSLEPYGISYPREWTQTWMGLPDEQRFIVDLAINPKLDDAALTIPSDVIAAHPRPKDIDTDPIGYGGGGKPHELAPGITEVPGGWNIAFIKQRDGIVMIEAPWSTGYTLRGIDMARALYGMPVKAVITTSDSWPHIAGVRQAVAEGIPVYALDLNKPILERLVTAPHTMHPDDLQRRHRKAKFVFVTKPLTIGDGPNRLTIYPYRTITAERQMMVYFPEHHLLYTSDLFSQADSADDWFTPQYLHEAIGAIDRYGLKPETVFGMHYDAMPYQKIVDIVNKWLASPSP